jgi:hypothetical protein
MGTTGCSGFQRRMDVLASPGGASVLGNGRNDITERSMTRLALRRRMRAVMAGGGACGSEEMSGPLASELDGIATIFPDLDAHSLLVARPRNEIASLVNLPSDQKQSFALLAGRVVLNPRGQSAGKGIPPRGVFQ